MWVAGLSRTLEAVFYVIVICYFCVRMWCVLQQSVQDETPRISMLWGFKDVFSHIAVTNCNSGHAIQGLACSCINMTKHVYS